MSRLIPAIYRMALSSGLATFSLFAQLKTVESPSAVTGYLLGPDDQISIRVMQAPELIDKPVRVDVNGYISLPYIGSIKAAGQTPESLKSELTERYRSIVRDPELSVGIEDFRSQPVSVIGAVNTPGLHQLRGRKRLLEVLSMAGGLRQDSGSTLTITRQIEYGAFGLRGETTDPDGGFRTVSIDVGLLLDGETPQANVVIQPNDVVAVAKARMIYVMGDVAKTGGFVLAERKGLSVLEALSLAGGPNRTASLKGARILRAAQGEPRHQEVEVNIQGILDGKEKDGELRAEDILYVPSSVAKRVTIRALEAAIQVGTGIAIWRP